MWIPPTTRWMIQRSPATTATAGRFGGTDSTRWSRSFTPCPQARKAASMASRRAKVPSASSGRALLVSVACCAPLLLAGLRIAADAPDTTASSPSVRHNPPIALAAGDDAAAHQPQQQPQSRPQSQPVATAPANPVRLPGWPFEKPGRPVAGTPAPNDEEWRQTVALFSEISPARWQVFEQVLAKPGRRERGRRYLFARYNELREFQKTNPGAYQAKIQQVKFEDEVFRLDTAIRTAASQADAEKLRAQLRDTVMERVKKDQNDREQRL